MVSRALIVAACVVVLAACGPRADLAPAPAPRSETTLLVDLHPGHMLVVSVVVQCEQAPPLIFRQVRDQQVLNVPACGRVGVLVLHGRQPLWGAEHYFEPGVAYRLRIAHPATHSSLLHVRA